MLEQIKVNPESNVSLTAQLVEQIRYLIASSSLNAGDQLPPIRDFAAQLGIHMHTVRIAYQRLEADGLVSIEGRRGTIVQAFSPTEMAEKGGITHSFTFGVLLPAYNLVYGEMIRGITEVTHQNHWLPMFSFTNNNPVLADRVVNQMVAKQVDGLIVVATGMIGVFEDSSRLEKLPPIVFVDSPDMPGYRVLCNNSGAAYLSTQHLIDHGHSRIGMITAPQDWSNVMECTNGFRQALKENDLEFDRTLIGEAADFSPDSGYRAGKDIFSKGERPRAVFAASDSLAVGLLRALSELGLSVPGDVAVTSFNDSPYAEMIHPLLTSSSFPAFELGAAAAEMLNQAILGEAVPEKRVVFPSVLAIRQSCGC